MGPIGIIAWTAFIGWSIFLLYSRVFMLGKSSSEVESSKN